MSLGHQLSHQDVLHKSWRLILTIPAWKAAAPYFCRITFSSSIGYACLNMLLHARISYLCHWIAQFSTLCSDYEEYFPLTDAGTKTTLSCVCSVNALLRCQEYFLPMDIKPANAEALIKMNLETASLNNLIVILVVIMHLLWDILSQRQIAWIKVIVHCRDRQWWLYLSLLDKLTLFWAVV